VRKRARIRMGTVSSFWVLVTSGAQVRGLEAEGALILNVLVFDGVKPVPEREAAGDHDADQRADEEEQAVRGQGDKKDCDDRDGDDEPGGSGDAEAESRIWVHAAILAPRWGARTRARLHRCRARSTGTTAAARSEETNLQGPALSVDADGSEGEEHLADLRHRDAGLRVSKRDNCKEER